MRVIPLAADSLGVRSMATYVECGSARLLIDPGATLAPHRFGLPPSTAEWEALRRANDRISGYAARANLVFVSHYHEEHLRHDPALYAGRGLWAKDPAHDVGATQRQRAAELRRAVGTGARWQTAEGMALDLPEAEVTASPSLPHGEEGTPLGHVVGLTVTDRLEGRRFVFASDVQGPLSPVVTVWLIRQRPHLVYLSGPPAYLERDLGPGPIDQGAANCLRLVEATGTRVIFDHYAVRDVRYRERFGRLWQTGKVVTAAGFLGLEDQPLEARRRELWASARKPPAPAAARGWSATDETATRAQRTFKRARGGRSG